MLKERRPDVIVCQFWHIPWPNSEVFRVCPWNEELLHGLLGNDVLGFHIQYHCNNFLDTVERVIEARVDYESFSVTRGGHRTKVRPFPISIATELEAATVTNGGAPRASEALAGLGLAAEHALVVGVDRIDYTKGIPERLR